MERDSAKLDHRVIERLEGPLVEDLRENFKSATADFVRVHPGGQILTGHYVDWSKIFDEFQVNSDDVWVATFPKSGTTWTQELVWSLLFDTESEDAKKDQLIRFPYFEGCSVDNPKNFDADVDDIEPVWPGRNWKAVINQKSPKLFKTHLALESLPNQFECVKPRVIYVMREPKDVCVSYYYHCKKLKGYTGDFDLFVDLFLADTLNFAPFWPHILPFWKKRNDANVLLIRYEEMKEDLPAMVRRIAKFLRIDLTEEKVQKVVRRCSFDTMSKDKAVSNREVPFVRLDEETMKLKFLRKGIVGDWKNHLSQDQLRRFKEWTLKNVKGTDFPFYQDFA